MCFASMEYIIYHKCPNEIFGSIKDLFFFVYCGIIKSIKRGEIL